MEKKNRISLESLKYNKKRTKYIFKKAKFKANEKTIAFVLLMLIRIVNIRH